MADTLAEKICRTIRDDIIEGKLNHQSFLTEQDLADRFSVSKAPVRDALHRLCQEGYLISYPRKGYMVDLLTQSEVEQIQQVRAHLEQMSIRLTVRKASDQDIASLYETISDPGTHKNPYQTNNTRFHLRLAEISGNQYLYSVLHSLLGASSRAVILNITQPIDEAMEGHKRIIEALINRDEEAAIQALLVDIH